MELTYTLVGEYYLPNIILTEREGEHPPLGRYGLMHKEYPQEHRPILYNQLLLTERIYPLCREIDQAAANRLATIKDREVANEIIRSELVYD